MSGRADHALVFNRASVGYGSRVVVAEASFTVRAGEFLGIVGPNGAGKSTLVRAVTGGADVLAGGITCDGFSVAGLRERERARLIGVVPQALPAPFGFTARAFVEMGRHAYLPRLGSPGPVDRAVVDDVMARTDTVRLVGQRTDELSGGDLQRLVLAQALAQRPRVLLLDEPTSHLDLNHTLQVLELVRTLADEGMAVVGVFHDLGLAARYADRIAIVAEGQMRAPSAPREALTGDTIASVFGVRSVVRTDPVTGALAVTPLVRDEDIATGLTRQPIGLVCGSGTGAALMRRLMRAGHPIEGGALNLGDVDQAVAAALGAHRTDLPAFGDVDPHTEDRVRAAYAQCAAVVVCSTPFGRPNVPNLRAALGAGVPTLLVGSMDESRDFTGGTALALWTEAVSSGAIRVDTEDAAYDALRDIMASGEGR